MTQENRRAPGYEERQIQVELDGKMVWVDPELAPLLVELTKVGLITRSHCCGHGSGHAFVVIRTESITEVAVRTEGEYQELVLSWKIKEVE